MQSWDRSNFDKDLTQVSAWCGQLYVISSDETVSKDIIQLGHWAWDHVEIFKSLLKQDQIFVDVGAYIGHHSVAILNAFRGMVPVVSIEGQPDYARILTMNMNLQLFRQFEVINAVASNTSGTFSVPVIELAATRNFGSLSYVENGPVLKDEKTLVPQITLDQVLSEKKNIGLIKIDVQTFELFVIQGSIDILKRDLPSLFIEISPSLMKSGPNYDYRRIYSLLVSLGYLLFDVLGNILPLDLIKNPEFYEEGVEWDVVAVHQRNINLLKTIPWMS